MFTLKSGILRHLHQGESDDTAEARGELSRVSGRVRSQQFSRVMVGIGLHQRYHDTPGWHADATSDQAHVGLVDSKSVANALIRHFACGSHAESMGSE